MANTSTTTTSSTPVDNLAAAETSGAEAYRLVLAWSVALALGMLLNKTRVGHVAIYYGLCLLLLLLVVTQADWFADALSPITGKTARDYAQAISEAKPTTAVRSVASSAGNAVATVTEKISGKVRS